MNGLRLVCVLAVVITAGLVGSGRSRVHTASAVTGTQVGVMGDVTCNAAVDLNDVLALARSNAGLLPNPGCMVVAADVTCDNEVDAVDTLRVLRYVAGLPNNSIEGCETVGEAIFAGPSSASLIAAALEHGDITAQEALVYGVMAAYGDPGLPQNLRGDDAPIPSSLDAARAYEGWSTLSPGQQAAIAPYLLPPNAEGSWYSPGGGFSESRGFGDLVSHLVNVTGTNGIRIWTSPSFPAQSLADLSTTMSQVLATTKNLMNRVPLDDSSAPGNQVDGALDVFVVPGLVSGALAKWYEPNACKHGPMYIEVNQDALPAMLTPTSGGFAHSIQALAHAVTQATAGGVDTPGACVFGNQFRWAVEATAALTEHLAYPGVNSEHRWDDVFESAHVSLDALAEGGQSLWTLFAHLDEDDPGVVGQMWDAAATSANAQVALDGVTDLATSFPEYALELLNTAPYDHFRTAHGILGSVRLNVGLSGTGLGNVVNIVLNGLPSIEIKPALTALDDFSAQHYSFKVADPAVKSLGFSNLIHNVASTSFQALTKEQGSSEWHFADLTTKALEHLCLADLGNNISDVMLVMTHFDMDNLTPVPFPDKPLVEARDSCGFTGTVTQTKHITCIDPCGEPGVNVIYSMTATNLVFKRAETLVEDEEYYLLESGTVHWQVTGFTSEDCSIQGDDTVQLLPGKGAIRLKHTDAGINYVLYGYFGDSPNPTPESHWEYDVDCSTVSHHTVETGIWMCSGGKRTSNNDSVLSGSFGLTYTEVQGFGCPAATSAVIASEEGSPGGNNGPRLGSTDRTFSWNIQR